MPTRGEYQEFLAYLFHDHIEGKLGQLRLDNMRHRIHRFEDWQYHYDYLMRARLILRFASDFYGRDVDSDDMRRVFDQQWLVSSLLPIARGVRVNNDFVVSTGISDTVQDYFGEIIDGMSVDDFPEEDFNALRRSGSSNPRGELSALVYLLKSRKEEILSLGRQVSFSQQLEQVPQMIEQGSESLNAEPPKESPNNRKEPGRKWWTGVASVCEGAILSITDVSVAAGLWSVPLSAETTTVGSVVSISAGIGKILMGIGSLRGE